MSVHPHLVNLSDSGSWLLNLPEELEEHQGELESLLHKVFTLDTQLSRSAQLRNLALAQQMTMNWCIRKRRQIGVGV